MANLAFIFFSSAIGAKAGSWGCLQAILYCIKRTGNHRYWPSPLCHFLKAKMAPWSYLPHFIYYLNIYILPPIVVHKAYNNSLKHLQLKQKSKKPTTNLSPPVKRCLQLFKPQNPWQTTRPWSTSWRSGWGANLFREPLPHSHDRNGLSSSQCQMGHPKQWGSQQMAKVDGPSNKCVPDHEYHNWYLELKQTGSQCSYFKMGRICSWGLAPAKSQAAASWTTCCFWIVFKGSPAKSVLQ